MPEFKRKLLYDVINHEIEFHSELPASSFFKSIALDICREFNMDFDKLRRETIEWRNAMQAQSRAS